MSSAAHYVIEKLGEALAEAEAQIGLLQARVAELESDAEKKKTDQPAGTNGQPVK